MAAVSPELDLLVLCELNPDVLVVDANLDIRLGQVERLVADAEITLGSSGAITAAAAAAQGLRVGVCAVVGADLAGEVATRRLAELGVDVGAVRVESGRRTGLTVVLSRPDGDRSLLTFPGSMADLTVAQLPTVAARHVHVSSIFLQTGLHPGLAAWLTEARAQGATTSLDPGWDPAEAWTGALSFLPAIDFLLSNAAETLHLAAALTGAPVLELALAARTLADCGPIVVAKAGADGGLATDGTSFWRCAAAPAELVDTTGAGDNFDAGFLAGLLSGADLPACLARAVATGSWSLAGRGGTGRLASASQALEAAARLTCTPIRRPAEELA